MKMLKNAYAEAKRLLSENREAMDQIAAFLIEKETITGKEFMKIFRQVKGIPEPEEGKKEEKNRMGGEFDGNAESQPVQATETSQVQDPGVQVAEHVQNAPVNENGGYAGAADGQRMPQAGNGQDPMDQQN